MIEAKETRIHAVDELISGMAFRAFAPIDEWSEAVTCLVKIVVEKRLSPKAITFHLPDDEWEIILWAA